MLKTKSHYRFLLIIVSYFVRSIEILWFLRVYMTNLIRVSKLMADRGMCSRREADELIRRQWVKVNGHIVSLGERAASDAQIELHPRAKEQLKQQVTILINKPVGYVSGQAEKNYKPASVLITPERQFILPAERRGAQLRFQDRKSTRLNSSHVAISYAV